jgi:hypothetical protein
MTSKGIVFARFPHAVADHYDLAIQEGKPAATQKAHWYIRAASGGMIIGRGPTEQAAWDDATIRIQCGEFDKKTV